MLSLKADTGYGSTESRKLDGPSKSLDRNRVYTYLLLIHCALLLVRVSLQKGTEYKEDILLGRLEHNCVLV